MKDFVNLRYLTKEQIIDLLDLGDKLKKNSLIGVENNHLKGKTVITSFPPTSLRTRISFEAGIYKLGGQAINMSIDFEGKEPMEDKVGYLNCWIDYLVIRNPNQELIENISNLAEFSVVNAMSKKYHPCEILGDLMAIRQLRGDLTSLKFVFVGEGANISNTWFEAAAKLNLSLTQVCPTGYEIDSEIFNYAKDNSSGQIAITNDIEEGLKNADIILTDGWSVTEENSIEYGKFLQNQITQYKLKFANKDCIVNPCPPFTRGNEITNGVINSEHFIGYKAKECLLYMQNAILISLDRKL